MSTEHLALMAAGSRPLPASEASLLYAAEEGEVVFKNFK